MAPAPNTLAGTKIDIHLESDPNCTSIGCETRYANPSEEEAWKKIGYSPLDAPLDKDVQIQRIQLKRLLSQQERSGAFCKPALKFTLKTK
jgi:hypothetical protein